MNEWNVTNRCFKPWENLQTFLEKRYVSYQRFPVFLPQETYIVAEQYLLTRKQKCFQMSPARKTLFSRLDMLKQCSKTIVQT